MSPNIKVLIKILKKISKKYPIEIFLLISALILTLISGIFYFKDSSSTQEDEEIFQEKNSHQENQILEKIFVEIAGAVEKPDVYEVTPGARLKDVLIKAGGLSPQADRDFFYRNFNLAKIVNDQEKFYIPSTDEINSGLFKEILQTLDYTQTKQPIVLGNSKELVKNNNNQLININTATMEELDSLPGVGKVTAQKIIQNRPYFSIEDLLNKKVVGKSVFEKIKNLITL